MLPLWLLQREKEGDPLPTKTVKSGKEEGRIPFDSPVAGLVDSVSPAGVHVLLDQSDMGYKDLRRNCVGGTFGSFLNSTNTREIGLLPKIQPQLVELYGNTALAGCEDAMLSHVAAQHLAHIGDRLKITNLSQCSNVDDIFLEHLYLQRSQEE